MKLGVVADEISRDFATAIRLGKSVQLWRYEVRFLKSGRAPMCDESELREVEKLARDEGVASTGLSPGLFKNVTDEAAFPHEMKENDPRAAELAQRRDSPL